MFIQIVVFGLGASASVLMSHSKVVGLIGISLPEAIVQNPFPKCVFAGHKLKVLQRIRNLLQKIASLPYSGYFLQGKICQRQVSCTRYEFHHAHEFEASK